MVSQTPVMATLRLRPPTGARPDDIYEVTIPPNVHSGEMMTIGLPDGRVQTLVVPQGLGPGAKVQLAVPPKHGPLESIADAAKRAAQAVQDKAAREQWELKAKMAASSALTAGSNFIAGFKDGLKGDNHHAARTPAPAVVQSPESGQRASDANDEPPPYFPLAAGGAASTSAPERIVVAIVPEGGVPGMIMLVATPDGERQINVPMGARAGTVLHVRY